MTQTPTPPPPGGKLPRGIRNNNPGNLRDFGAKWRGKVGNDGKKPADGSFVKFDTMASGIRAAAQNARTQMQRGHNTLAKLTAVWAPASDHNDPNGYAHFLARRLGIGVHAALSSSNRDQLAKLVHGIADQENGPGFLTLATVVAAIKSL